MVHSCIYYELDGNIVDDRTWDKWARELVQLQKDYPEEAKVTIWYEAFADWDASTGAFLPLKDPWVVKKAKFLLHLQNKNFGNSNKPAATVKVNKQGVRKLF